jgi:hypothetical protein
MLSHNSSYPYAKCYRTTVSPTLNRLNIPISLRTRYLPHVYLIPQPIHRSINPLVEQEVRAFFPLATTDISGLSALGGIFTDDDLFLCNFLD